MTLPATAHLKLQHTTCYHGCPVNSGELFSPNISSMENGVREPASSVETEVVKSLGSTAASVLVNKLDCMVKPASLAREKQTDSNNELRLIRSHYIPAPGNRVRTCESTSVSSPLPFSRLLNLRPTLVILLEKMLLKTATILPQLQTHFLSSVSWLTRSSVMLSIEHSS